jgi:hypothetical protein
MRLDNTKVKKWKDLVDAFMRQYKFNIDVGPDRLSLSYGEEQQGVHKRIRPKME